MDEELRDPAVPLPLPDTGRVPPKLPWGKIAAVVLLILVIIAVLLLAGIFYLRGRRT